MFIVINATFRVLFLMPTFLCWNLQDTVVVVYPRASDADYVLESALVKDPRVSVQVDDFLFSLNVILLK